MKYKTTLKKLDDVKCDCICLPVFKDGSLGETGQQIDSLCDGQISQAINNFNIKSEAGSGFMLPVKGQAWGRVLLIGLAPSTHDTQKKAAQAIASHVKDSNIKHLLIAFTDLSDDNANQSKITRTIIESIEGALYSFDQFKSKKSPSPSLSQVSFHCTTDNQSAYKNIISISQAMVSGVNIAKDLGNLPGNVCTPSYLADTAMKLEKQNKAFQVKVLEEAELEKLKMGAFLSVSKGSVEPGKLIVIEYQGGKKSDAPHVLVGKGITFDSGGISLKPGPQMDEMKYDMCGAASVLGCMTAIAELKPKLNIIAIIATAENMPAGNASKPGDIVTTASGQTVEILNTDAEGRLVLCDALTYAEQFKPASVVDIATLTGACIVALGHCTSAVMSNNDELAKELLEAGQQANDKAWQLPLWDDYQTQLDSPFADMQNIGGKGAGSITAACFLSRFAKKYKWAHLDIAGTAWVSGGKDKGATGRPVPLLLQYLLNKNPK